MQTLPPQAPHPCKRDVIIPSLQLLLPTCTPVGLGLAVHGIRAIVRGCVRRCAQKRDTPFQAGARTEHRLSLLDDLYGYRVR